MVKYIVVNPEFSNFVVAACEVVCQLEEVKIALLQMSISSSTNF